MVRIIDASLREGMQTPAGTFSLEQSVEVASQLALAGVDTIECGHPRIDEYEHARVAAVVRAVAGTPVLAHARACAEDIDAVASTGAAWVGIFLGINDYSRQHRVVGSTTDQLLERIDGNVRHARELGLQVRFTIEDSSRTPDPELFDALRVAVAAGADRLCFSDTTGALEPEVVRARVAAIRSAFTSTAIEVHLHDDRGLSMANALAGIDAGADWVSTSVNGLGERAGVTDLATLLFNLDLRGQRPLPAAGLLQDLSRRVGSYSRSHPDARRPVLGRDVFHHVSRLHTRAVRREPYTYELMPPSRLGRQRSMQAPQLPRNPEDWIVRPPVISADELRYHRAGPGERFVLVDDRFVPGAGQYCIARRIPNRPDHGRGHVDTHVHHCDSLFGFLGEGEGYTGLRVEVQLGDLVKVLDSPASVFIPAGVPHSYRALSGGGTYLNHVLSGSYEESLLDPPAAELGSPQGDTMDQPVTNAKAEAWDNVGSLFWQQGRVSARPSQAELDLFTSGISAGSRCTVVGASTKHLVQTLVELGAQVTVLDFSQQMCADLAVAVDQADVRVHDITTPAPAELAGTQDYVLCDRLVNRFGPAEAAAGLSGMVGLLAEGGQLRATIKLGLYPMDEQMIALGEQRGTLTTFWDEQTSTIDFGTAGSVLDDALLPHGDIDPAILLAWYRGRGKEQRFSHQDVLNLLAESRAGGTAVESVTDAELPDAPKTRLYVATVAERVHSSEAAAGTRR